MKEDTSKVNNYLLKVRLILGGFIKNDTSSMTAKNLLTSSVITNQPFEGV